MNRRRGGLVLLAAAAAIAGYFGLVASKRPTARPAATPSTTAAGPIASDAAVMSIVEPADAGMAALSVDPSSHVPPPKVDPRCPSGMEMKDGSLSHPPNAKGCVARRADDSLWREGTWTMTLADGRVEVGDYVHDLREGRWTIWYAKGGKAEESNYLHDVRQGWQTAWDEDGRRVVERHYDRGALDGPVTIYRPDGRVIREVWKAGVRVDPPNDPMDGGLPPIVIPIH